jgi:hypothetical protein
VRLVRTRALVILATLLLVATWGAAPARPAARACVLGPPPADQVSIAVGLLTTSRGPAVTTLGTDRGDARICGSLTISFQGDPAAGCAGAGLCGVSGTVTWTPQGSAELGDQRFEQSGRTRLVGTISPVFTNVQAHGPSVTVTRIDSAGIVHTCTDRAPEPPELELSGPPRRVALQMVIADPALAERCAGPLARDLASLLPSASVAFATLRKGVQLDLARQGTFTAHGLSGEITSTLTLVTGRLHTQLATPQLVAPVPRQRLLEARYTITAARGEVSADIAGPAAAGQCAALDACGLQSTIHQITSASGGSLYISLPAPRHPDGQSPREQLRRVLASASGQGAGGGTLNGVRAGTVTVTRPDDTATCTDSFTGRPDALGVVIRRGAATLLDTGDSTTGFPGVLDDALRSHCPGPYAADLRAPAGLLSSAPIPAQALSRGTLTIALDRGARWSTKQGFIVTTTGGLTLTLHLHGVSELNLPW